MTHSHDSVPQTTLLDTINQAIVVAHGSATNPHYGFLQKTYDRRPYQPVVDALALRFALTETTDLNYDRSFVYTLLHKVLEQKEGYSLYLSLVGKFFVLFHFIVDTIHLVEQPATEEAKAVFRAVQQHGFVPIDRATLEHSTCLEDDEGGKKTVWEALFYDGESPLATA